MAFVRGVMAFSTSAAVRFSVSHSTSARTTLPPACRMVLAVAQNVIGVVMTSSPGFRSSAASERCRAAVQESTQMAFRAPV